jgi:hypothetical protein
MAVWQSTEVATTVQLAEFYEVGVDALKSILRRNKEEFEQDGVKVLEGSDLKFDSVSLTLSSRTNRLTIWTPRAALRLGMVLQDSPVARRVRSVILDIVEEASPRSKQPKLATSSLDLSVLAHGQLKRLFYYRINIECGNGSVEQLVEDIDPIFWQADSKSVAIAFEQHSLELEERYLVQSQQQLQSVKRSIRLRKKYLSELVEGQAPQLLPDFARYYPVRIFEQDDRCIL